MDLEDNNRKTQRAIQSVEVGGRLLLALGHSAGPLSLKDLAARAELPPSRAHPYLVSYGRLGLVQQDSASGLYALGPAALQLGLTALQQCNPVAVARPLAEALADETGQAVAVAVWGNLGPTVIHMIDARLPLHVSMRAGTVMSLFGTATGRAFAAVLRSQRLLDAHGGQPLGAGAGAAVRGAKAAGPYAADVQAAREEYQRHGCTRAVGRPMPGVNAFSAPAFNHEGQPVLVFTLLGHQDHVPAAWSSPAAVALRRAVAEVSQRLGLRNPRD